MLGKRMLTAAIGVPVTIYIINFGQWLFSAAIFIIAFLAWNEFATILNRKQISVFYSAGFLGVLFLLGCAWVGNSQEFMMVITAVMIVVLLRSVTHCGTFSILDAAFTILGFLYVGVAFSHLLLLRFLDSDVLFITRFGSLSNGAMYLWLPFIGTWASDTFAYFIGTRWGKHKLCPAISPSKSIEGALGGLLGSLLGVLALGICFQLPLVHTIVIGLLVGFVAPCGDLVESALKRFAGVKDSGRLLPGHGGVLDRFDSIMFAVPVVYYYIYLGML